MPDFRPGSESHSRSSHDIGEPIISDQATRALQVSAAAEAFMQSSEDLATIIRDPSLPSNVLGLAGIDVSALPQEARELVKTGQIIERNRPEGFNPNTVVSLSGLCIEALDTVVRNVKAWNPQVLSSKQPWPYNLDGWSKI